MNRGSEREDRTEAPAGARKPKALSVTPSLPRAPKFLMRLLQHIQVLYISSFDACSQLYVSILLAPQNPTHLFSRNLPYPRSRDARCLSTK